MAIDTGVDAANFTPTINTYLDDVEKFASQEIYLAKSANPLDAEFPLVEVGNGSTLEKAVMEMAEGYAYDPTAALGWAQDDPVLHVKFYSEWAARQFEGTYRRNEVRKIIMSGKSAEDFAAMITASLTEGEGDEDFQNTRAAFIDPTLWVDYSSINGGKKAVTLDGIMYLIRDAYMHLIATNDDATGTKYRSKTDPEDVRIVIPSKLLNLIDVTKLANVFNLEKTELMGKIVAYNVDDLDLTKINAYGVVVCDKKAIVRGRRTYEFTEDRSGRGGFVNYFLTVDRLYGVCDLFKGVYIDFSDAAESVLGVILADVTP